MFFWWFLYNSASMFYFCAGEMAERSNAAVLKTVDCHRSGGSNPSLSAQKTNAPLWGIFRWWSVENLFSKATAMKNDEGEAPAFVFWSGLIRCPSTARTIPLSPQVQKPAQCAGFFCFIRVWTVGSSEYLKQKKQMPRSGMAFEPEFPQKGSVKLIPKKGSKNNPSPRSKTTL